MKEPNGPASESPRRIEAVVFGGITAWVLEVGSYTWKDNAEPFWVNLLLATLLTVLWLGIICTYAIETRYQWRQLRRRWQLKMLLGFTVWIVTGTLLTGMGAAISLHGCLLRLSLSDDLR